MKILSLLDKSTRENLLILFACGLLFELSTTSLLPIIPAYLKEVCSTIQEVGLIMGFFAIGLILSRNFLGNMADKQGRKIVILIGTISGVLVPLGYLLIKSLYGLIFIRILGGISLAAFSTAYDALVVDLSPYKYKGEIISYMNLVSPLSFCLGPLIGDVISEKIGYNGIFLVSLAISLLAAFFALKVKETSIKANLNYTSNHQPINNFIKNQVIGLLGRDSFLIPT
ncbi:MAG: MFS transporter, partial [Symploca sp. SIO3E6]|nr:MFS transporter [Caldora sp. SIO3E6]